MLVWRLSHNGVLASRSTKVVGASRSTVYTLESVRGPVFSELFSGVLESVRYIFAECIRSHSDTFPLLLGGGNDVQTRDKLKANE